MKRYAGFLFALLRMRLSQMMVFRLTFFGGFFVDGTMFALQILMFNAIYAHTPGIGGWGRGEMLVFIGTFSLLNALSMVLVFFGLNGIPQKIKNGTLDLYITRPMSPLVRLVFERVDLGSLPLVALSIGIIGYGVRVMGVPLAFGRVAGYAALVLLMEILYCDMELILRTIPFFTISAMGIERLEGELITLCMKLPGICLQGAMKTLFYVVLPYGIMATLPTQMLSGLLSLKGCLFAFCMAATFTAFALLFWRAGLRAYKSPGL